MPLTVVVNEKRDQGRGATTGTTSTVGTTIAVYQSLGFGTPVGAGRKVWHTKAKLEYAAPDRAAVALQVCHWLWVDMRRFFSLRIAVFMACMAYDPSI